MRHMLGGSWEGNCVRIAAAQRNSLGVVLLWGCRAAIRF